MYTGRTIFSQLMDFLPRDDFHQCVQRYDGDHKIKTFSCFDQYLTMAFAQITSRESLRDIEVSLRTFGPKLYHAGFPHRIFQKAKINIDIRGVFNTTVMTVLEYSGWVPGY